MMKRRRQRERKHPGGIALKPSLWELIDRIADAQDKSRNQVMEEVLSLHVPALSDSTNLSSKTEEDESSEVF